MIAHDGSNCRNGGREERADDNLRALRNKRAGRRCSLLRRCSLVTGHQQQIRIPRVEEGELRGVHQAFGERPSCRRAIGERKKDSHTHGSMPPWYIGEPYEFRFLTHQRVARRGA